MRHPWLSTSQPSTPISSASLQTQQQEEYKIIDHLLGAGFDTSVIKEMRVNHVGMLGTLWSMLVRKTQETKKEEGWMNSFKSWFISKPSKTEVAPPIITTAPLMEDPTSSTCSSSADDDTSSIHSSPATSLEDDDDDDSSKHCIEPLSLLSPVHRVSPMVRKIPWQY